MTDERRRFTRIAFDADVLISKDGKEWRSTLLDISLNGMLIETPENWDAIINERFHIEVIFIDSGSLIHVDATVAHTHDNQTGFKIDSIDVESVGHLRRLVELNIGDETLLNRELALLNKK